VGRRTGGQTNDVQPGQNVRLKKFRDCQHSDGYFCRDEGGTADYKFILLDNPQPVGGVLNDLLNNQTKKGRRRKTFTSGVKGSNSPEKNRRMARKPDPKT